MEKTKHIYTYLTITIQKKLVRFHSRGRVRSSTADARKSFPRPIGPQRQNNKLTRKDCGIICSCRVETCTPLNEMAPDSSHAALHSCTQKTKHIRKKRGGAEEAPPDTAPKQRPTSGGREKQQHSVRKRTQTQHRPAETYGAERVNRISP